MLFNQQILKLQFKLDHMPLSKRAAIAGGLLLSVFLIWSLLIYSPLSGQISEVKRYISVLGLQEQALAARNEEILMHVKTRDMDPFIAKYGRMQSEKKALEKAILTYRYRYISDKALAKLLYEILEDMNDLSIEQFTTIVEAEKKPVADVAKDATKKDKKNPEKKAASKPAMLAPTLKRYVLSLKGDYFSIMQFLARVEALKWELFWDKFNYHVKQYPEGVATIEFYTLKAAEGNNQ